MSGAADNLGMSDPMLVVLWLLALRIAGGENVVLDLSTWPRRAEVATA